MLTREDELKQIGLNISYFRKARGYSQMALAEKAGISRAYLSTIEAPNLSTSMSLDVLLDIAKALDIPAEKLLHFNEL